MDRPQTKDEVKEAGFQLAQDFCKHINSFTNYDEFIEGFVQGMMQEHRTLQQGAMRGIYQLILAWADMGEKGWYDGRNEATVHFCQNIKALAEKDNVHFPFI